MAGVPECLTGVTSTASACSHVRTSSKELLRGETEREGGGGATRRKQVREESKRADLGTVAGVYGFAARIAAVAGRRGGGGLQRQVATACLTLSVCPFVSSPICLCLHVRP